MLPRSAEAAPLTAADKVNDLEAIVRLNRGLLPFRARQNIEIALDSHPLGSHFQVLKQGGNGEAVRNFTKLAVDRNFHGSRAVCNLIRGFLIGWLA
jgi:hypothetical protein